MRKVVFVIDGWFMRKRIYRLKSFLYDGPNIRKYCKKHLRNDDALYRIFYYDTEPLSKKGHNPVSGNPIDFGQTKVAINQNKLLDSIRRTPNFALRLGSSIWHNDWILKTDKLKQLINNKIEVKDLTEYLLFGRLFHQGNIQDNTLRLTSLMDIVSIPFFVDVTEAGTISVAMDSS